MQAPLNIQIASELDDEAKKVDFVSKEVLGHNYMTLLVESLNLDENCAELTSVLTAHLEIANGEKSRKMRVEGRGVGLVDASFDAMMKAFAPENISLKGLLIDDFSISSKFRDTEGRKSDAYAIALLRVRNPENHTFTFTHRTPSISRSSLAVVTHAFAFFVNSERAFSHLHLAMEDAKSRNRQDLVERIQRQMAVLVNATSYKEVASLLSQKAKGVAN